MLPSVILGLGILVAAILLMRWYANADPAVLKKALKSIAIIVLALVALFLALTGRFAAAIGMFMGLVAFGWRLFNMVVMAQQMRGLFSGLGRGFGGGGTAAAGQSSQVEAQFLRMTLDHDTGAMDGEILLGVFQGRILSAMTLKDLLDLRSEVSADTDSLSLLEAFLDRAHVGWQQDAGAAEGGSAGGSGTGAGGSGNSVASGPMTREEAYLALGLEPGASRRDIKAAYRNLMSKVHPDKGGSAYLAAKINEAKDLLLSD